MALQLPGYENERTLTVQPGANIQPDNAIGSALQSLGPKLEGLGVALSVDEESANRMLKANANRAENIQLQNDLIDYKNRRRDVLSQGVNDLSTTQDRGDGFYQGYEKSAIDDADAVVDAKYKNSPNYEKIKLEFRKAADPFLDQAAHAEFTQNRKFDDDVTGKKIADLNATVAGGGSYEDAAAEYKKFVDDTRPAGRVHDVVLQDGLRAIQRANADAEVARDPKKFISFYTQGMSADGNTKVLPPHISTTVANAQAAGEDPHFMLSLGWIESRLNPNAGMPTRKDGTVMSSATGMFQVLGGDNTDAAATRAAIGIQRGEEHDVAKVTTGLANYMIRNEDRMKSVGIEPTDGKKYMMWNMGEGLGWAMLKANPNTPVENVVYSVYRNRDPSYAYRVLHNNPSMYRPGMTVGQVIQNYENQMSAAGTQVDKITSGAGLTADDRARGVLVSALGADKSNLLSPRDVGEMADNASKLLATQAKQEDSIRRGQLVLNGEVKPDPFNSEDRKNVNAAIDASGVDFSTPLTEAKGQDLSTAHAQVIDVSKRAGFVPEKAANAITALVLGKGPEENKIAAYQAMSTLRTQDPVAYEASKFPDDIKSRLDDYRAFVDVDGMPPSDALKRIEFLHSDEGKKIAEKITGDEAEKKYLNKAMNGPKIAGLVGSKTIGFEGIDTPQLTARLQDAFAANYKFYRAQGKTPEEAESNAVRQISETWGPSQTFGGALVPYPVEKTLAGKQINGSFDWVKTQAHNAVGIHLLSTGQMKLATIDGGDKTTAQTPEELQVSQASGTADRTAKLSEVPIKDVMIVPTSATQDDVRAGNIPPRYALWYRDKNGMVQKANDNFRPDYNLAWEQEKARFGTDASKTQPRNTKVLTVTPEQLQSEQAFGDLSDSKRKSPSNLTKTITGALRAGSGHTQILPPALSRWNADGSPKN